jgi:hypothetical protein
MELVLTEDMFINNSYTVRYGDRAAEFTIIDEEFAGNNQLGRINRINCLVRTFDEAGSIIDEVLGTTVIGVGNNIVGVRSDYPELRGKLMTHENMDKCVVILYEQGGG